MAAERTGRRLLTMIRICGYKMKERQTTGGSGETLLTYRGIKYAIEEMRMRRDRYRYLKSQSSNMNLEMIL